MFNTVGIKIKRVSAVIRFGLLTLRYAGIKVALRQLAHQIYGQTVFLHYGVNIEPRLRSLKFPCYTVRASKEDLNEFFDQVHHESNEGKYQILVRKWYHERGLGTPYVQKTVDTDEVCSIQWLVTARDIKNNSLGYRFPELNEEEKEFLIENTYTLEMFRNKGVHTSAASQMREILLGMGLKRMKGIVAETNIVEIKFRKARGNQVFAKVLERHLFFRVSHKTLGRYDPPIPFMTPDEK